MKLTSKAQKIYSQLNIEGVKLGDLRKMAKEIKKDHDLAIELWSTGSFFCRQLAILILDRKKLDKEFTFLIFKDIQKHKFNECNQLADWLMANQLMKSKKTIAFLESWETAELSIMRRLFW